MLDLIREPGERHGAQAALRNRSPPHPMDFSSLCFRHGLFLGGKGHIVLLPQGHDGVSPLSLNKRFDLLSPTIFSFLPTNQLSQLRMFITLAALPPQALPGPKLGPGVQLAPT